MSDPLAPADRSAFAAFSSVATRWGDNDVYGHVNNVVHYAWFDTAVNRFLLEAGILDLRGTGPIFVVAETGCRYHASLAFPEAVDIGLAVDRLGTRSVTWRLGVFASGASTSAATGRFVHVCVDRETRRTTIISDGVRTALAELVVK